MSTRANIAYVRKNGTVITSYAHFDGGYNKLGLDLYENYNTKELAYTAASTWENGDINNAFEFNNLDEFFDWVEHTDREYVYVYTHGEWHGRKLRTELDIEPLYTRFMMNDISFSENNNEEDNRTWQEKGEITVGELVKYLSDLPQNNYVVFDNLRIEKRNL